MPTALEMRVTVAFMQNEVEVQHLYLGRSPPIFTEMRVLQQTNGDDHLVSAIGWSNFFLMISSCIVSQLYMLC